MRGVGTEANDEIWRCWVLTFLIEHLVFGRLIFGANTIAFDAIQNSIKVKEKFGQVVSVISPEIIYFQIFSLKLKHLTETNKVSF